MSNPIPRQGWWQGAKPIRLLVTLVVGLVLYVGLPKVAPVPEARIFTGTVTAKAGAKPAEKGQKDAEAKLKKQAAKPDSAEKKADSAGKKADSAGKKADSAAK